MKKIVALFLAVAVASACVAAPLDIKDLLNKVSGASDTTAVSNGQISTSDNGGGTSALGSFLGNLLGSGKIGVADLVGSWQYTSPAVTFKSDNLLKKAGGAAASAVVEEKLKEYYKKAGLDGMTLTVEADSTFTMKMKRVTVSGTIEKNADGNFQFNFKIGKKIPIGNMTAYISKAGDTVDITFDVSKLITLVDKIAAVSGNSTLSGISKLLNSYDGLCAGFTLKLVK
ncbi:MAG: DUF4923 family protein [Pseudoflavonifractor sp.]|nr:DUF4923 family protein [Pseudoflavonifractor sp.]